MQVLKEEVRQRILKSARRQFRKHGFEKSSMRSIASTANMTVGNLYRYYKNKEKLYEAIIQELLAEIEILRENLAGEPEERLNYLLEKFKEFQKNYRLEWLMLFEGSMGTKYAKVADNLQRTLQGVMTEILQKNNRHLDLVIPIASGTLYGLHAILKSEKNNSSNSVDSFLAYMMRIISD